MYGEETEPRDSIRSILDEMVDVSRTRHSQWRPVDRERETEGRPTGDRIPEITGIRRNSQWDFPRRRALFMSDGTYSISSESDTSEGHVDRPPEGECVAGRRTEERQDEDGAEGLGFPHKTLERAVTQLQKKLGDCHTEFEIIYF